MKSFLIALLVLLPTMASAQRFPLFTVQECGTPEDLFLPSVRYEEKGLFTGRASFLLATDEEVTGNLFFTVNQDTGTWTLFFQPHPEFICMVTFGEEFEPQ